MTTTYRRWRTIALGALLGFDASVAIFLLDRAALRAGEDPAGTAFGVAHALFFVSLPWSIGVLIVALPFGLVFDIGGPGLFYFMPVFAGACWAAVIEAVSRRIREAGAGPQGVDRIMRALRRRDRG